MAPSFSHFVLLGAGSASNFEQQINSSTKATLVEARAAACQQLKTKFNTPQTTVIQTLISDQTSTNIFYQYNLPELSSINPSSMLKLIYPGLKVITQETMASRAVHELITELPLNESNNALAIDILDINLRLIRALHDHQLLGKFQTLFIKTSSTPLYEGAASQEDIAQFMHQHGYLLQTTDARDPDMPVLMFAANPLWTKLQALQNENIELTTLLKNAQKELITLKQELSSIQQTFNVLEHDFKLAKQELIVEREAYDTLSKESALIKLELANYQQTTIGTENQLLGAEQDTSNRIQAEQALIKETITLKNELAQCQQALSDAEKQLANTKEDSTNQLQAKEAVSKEAAALKQELVKSRQTLSDLEKQLATVKQDAANQLQAKENASKEVIAIKRELADQLQAKDTASKEAIALRRELAENKQAQVDLEKQLKNSLEQQLMAMQESAIKQESSQKLLEERIKQMFTDQAQLLSKEVGNLKNHVNSGLGNTAKQLEAFWGIQNYLEKGTKPLSFHGWPISPDIGLYIAGLIDSNNYDVIIEFGSGTSTVLMAKALISKQRGVQTKVISHISESNEISVKDNNFSDLPARIVTFEHNSLYHEKTTQALKSSGVHHLVDLVHAPLVDYTYKDGNQYLYYNCNEKLKELAKVFKNRKANILVLVDGPPGATNKNARFPALPHLLNHLPEHSFTIIMDDYNRQEEKDIVSQWLALSEARFLNPTLETMTSEKGLASIKINCR